VADIEIDGSVLVVHIRGVDKFWALATKLEVPLAHIAGVDASVPDAHDAWHGWRVGGTNLPGVITAARFVQHGEWTFWDVHDPNKAIAIRLHDEGYGRLVIGVEDPQATAAAVNAALGRK
jgi:hypothetical protein